MLEDLVAQRAQGHHRNLIVAATGTGKTVMSAVDYARLAGVGGLRKLHKLPRLLFLAHRKEILTQARGTYRHALKDQSFGELFVDGHRPQKNQHIFASVQSMFNDLDRWPSDYFDIIVVDEFHHAEAATFKKILEHFQPRELLGMTATPERADGTNVAVSYFDGRIAAELRLWDALDADLLVPFHYFGVADGTDLSGVKFIAGAYDVASLQSLYVGNDQRSLSRRRMIRAAAPQDSINCEMARWRSCSPSIFLTKVSISRTSILFSCSARPSQQRCFCNNLDVDCEKRTEKHCSLCLISSEISTRSSDST